MKHEDFRIRYNEIMFDERDVIKSFLERQADIRYGKQMWEWCLNNVQVIAVNGSLYYCYEIFLEDGDVKFRMKPAIDWQGETEVWECSNFALGELSKIIDALPEIEKIIRTNAESDLKEFCKDCSVNLEGEEFRWEVGCAGYEVQEIALDNKGDLNCLVMHTDSLGKKTFLQVDHFDLDITQKLRDHVHVVILHRSKEYKKLMELLEKFDNLRCDFEHPDYFITPVGTDLTCMVLSVYRNADELYVLTDPGERIGDTFLFKEKDLKDCNLAICIEAVKDMLPVKMMTVTVSEVRSRTIEVEADDFNEAKKKAKEVLEKEPLNDGDSNGIQFL